MERRRNSIGKSKEYTVCRYEDGGGRDVCAGGEKKEYMTKILNKRGKNAPRQTCIIVVRLMIKTTRSWAFSVALWCTECQDVTLSGSLCTGK